MIDFSRPDNWPKRHLTPLDLGVPDEFISDGCTSAPDWSWIHPACRRHDLDYFMGGPESDRNEEFRLRHEADERLLAIAMHNSNYERDSPNGAARTRFWKRMKRYAAAYGGYFQAVRHTAKAVESFRVWDGGRLPAPLAPRFVEAARQAGKWGDGRHASLLEKAKALGLTEEEVRAEIARRRS